MKRILVPTDFSDYSRVALQFAANLAHQISGRIYLVHIFDDNGVDMPGSTGSGAWMGSSDRNEFPLLIDRLRSIKGHMQKFIQDAAVQGTDIYHNVEGGLTHMKINYAAEKYHCDIIIMSTHGATGIKEMILETTTEKVIHFADRPVLSLKEKVNFNPKRIVFASDFAEEADTTLERVKDFAEIFGAEVHLLYVNTNNVDRNQVTGMIDQFRKENTAFDCPYSIYNASKVETGIMNFAERMNADMVALGTHGRHGLARIFNPSISEELVNRCTLPVLTLNFSA
jgi:nucleotide-binding universal stress UspA family protein